jgi:phosphoglycerate dehydrogenase-like enzyme
VSRKVKIGLTRDCFDKVGKFMMPGPGLKLLDDMQGVEYSVFPDWQPEISPGQIDGFDMVVSLRPRWTQQSFSGNNQLLCVHRTGVGYDMIDVPALTEANVMLTITPDAVRRPVAVAILTFILALSTRLFTKDRMAREGRWAEKAHYHGYGLVGQTLGSIGVGNIGRDMFMLAKPLGMRHIAYDPYVKQEAVADAGVKLMDMDTVLAESDYVNISCLLNKSTYHLIGEKELRKMKKTAFLINTARGAIIDEAALIKILQEGRIRGAGIDAFEQEPTPDDNPLLKMDNVIVAPHALAWTDQMFLVQWEQIMNQLSQIIRGERPEALVNKEVWDKPGFQAKLKAFLSSIK